MDAKIVAKYLSGLKEKSGLTYEAIAEKSGRSVSTVKNLCSGKTEDPRLDTVAPVLYAVNGSVDEMYTGKSKNEIQEMSISSIKEMYEFQLSERANMEEAHITNIRNHYKQHVADLKENHEKQIAYKDEVIKEKNKQSIFLTILNCIGYGILIVLLILEVSNPSLGWIKF